MADEMLVRLVGQEAVAGDVDVVERPEVNVARAVRDVDAVPVLERVRRVRRVEDAGAVPVRGGTYGSWPVQAKVSDPMIVWPCVAAPPAKTVSRFGGLWLQNVALSHAPPPSR